MRMRIVTGLGATALVAALLGGVLSAQAARTRPGVAELAVMPAALPVQPGGSARAAISVRLPEGFHMNSDKPRDENLIPITVSMEAVPAVAGATTAFPEAIDLKQEGSPDPLRVFEREFAIGVQINVAADAAAGAHKLPLRVRYQACDEKQCYLPITAPLELNLSVSANAAPASKAAAPPASIAKLDFAKAAAVPIVAPKPLAPATAPPAAPIDAMAALDNFAVRGTEGGYLPAATFIKFVEDAKAGVARKGMFEGQGPLAILLIVFLGGLRMIIT